jgi:phospholipid/cholesterol/gamma-HCH transport system substrate-binding protein
VQKSVPTLGRILTMAAFALSCFGLLLFLWIAFGGAIPFGPQGYRFDIRFPEASQLAKEADVRISGVPVGKVKQLEPDPQSGLTRATIELDGKYAPISRDSRAILRQKTLLGETYVELTPGQDQVGSTEGGLAEGGTLPQAQVADTVQLDEIFRAFDPQTREAFRRWMENQALATRGRGADLNAALGNLAPTAEDANQLLEVLNRHEGSVHNLVRNTGEVLDALSARDGQLRSLIENSNAVFATTARQNEALQATFRVLPTFERESRTTLDRLARFATNADPLVTQLRPAARELSPTLQDLGLLSPDLRQLFADLDPLIRTARTGLPALRTTLDELRPVLAQLDPALRDLTPMVRFIGLYKRELTSFFANSQASTQATQLINLANGKKVRKHYLRTTNPLTVEALAPMPARLPSNRPNAYQLPGGMDTLRLSSLGQWRVFEDRQCHRGATSPRFALPAGVPTPVLNLVRQVEYAFFRDVNAAKPADITAYTGIVPAPKCIRQPAVGPATGFGTSDFPQVAEDPPAR